MEVREATTGDAEGIRTVALNSLSESYGHALDGTVVEAAVAGWYDDEQVAAAIADSDALFLVGLADGRVVAFAQGHVLDQDDIVGLIDWLHIDPNSRGQGLGRQLLARIEQELRDRDVNRVEGRVLEANETGGAFYRDHGYDRVGRRTVDIADRTFQEELYAKPVDDGKGGVRLGRQAGPDDRQLFVAYDESERASEAPFYAVYNDAERDDRYGYLCGNCGGFDVAVDSMDRVECNKCGNRRKPTRWDAAYL